jgi:hypothetical protein
LGMSALGQERPFRPGQPNGCFAPKAVISNLLPFGVHTDVA